MLGFVHAYHVVGLRHRAGWIGYGTHLHSAVFRKLVEPGGPEALVTAVLGVVGAGYRLAGARLVVQLWLRSGNATCGSNVEAFFLALWDARPRHLRLRAVRADSGFGAPELLALRERLGCQYIVLAKLSEPIQDLIRRDLVWTPTELAGTDVAELRCRAQSWPHPRRLTVLRHRAAERPEAGGKKLIEVPGFVLQSLVTSLPPSMPPLADWRDYDGRADCENVIKELQQGPADLVPALDLGHRSGADARDADV
jgi:hypothetical protein